MTHTDPLRPGLLLAAFAGCVTLSACAQPVADAAANDSAAVVAVAAESAEGWLDRLEAAAGDTRTLQSTLRMTSVAGFVGETTVRFGQLLYDAADNAHDKPARFAARFHRLMIDDKAEDIDMSYVFDGRYLLERDGQAKTATRRELVAEGETAELELGEGPFPIPLNLKKDRVLARFAVELVAADAANDPPVQDNAAGPAGSVHLLLTPLPRTDIEATRIDLWFSRDTLLPLRASTTQDDGDVTTIDLFGAVANGELPSETFDTSVPEEGEGWQVQDVPLE